MIKIVKDREDDVWLIINGTPYWVEVASLRLIPMFLHEENLMEEFGPLQEFRLQDSSEPFRYAQHPCGEMAEALRQAIALLDRWAR